MIDKYNVTTLIYQPKAKIFGIFVVNGFAAIL